MPISMDCPCGKALRVQEQLAGKKVKCPVCGEILNVPLLDAVGTQDEINVEDVVFQEISPSPKPIKVPPPVIDATGPTVALPPQPSEIPAQPASSMCVGGCGTLWSNQWLVRHFFGKTRITLTDDRVIEHTKRVFFERHCELLVSEIDSAEIRTTGDIRWLLFGILTIGIYGLGLLLILLYFLLKKRHLIIRSQNASIVLVIDSVSDDVLEFLHAVLYAKVASNA